MAYTTAAALKAYLGIDGAGDDALLATLIAGAQAVIDRYTGRTFEAAADSTRTLCVGKDSKGRMLYLDGDLAAITSVATNADNGSGGTALTVNTDYRTLPRNSTPYYALQLTAMTAYTWTYTADPEDGVAIVGKWAYSETAPDDIVQATLRLASYMYRQKDAQVFDVTAMAQSGMMMLPSGIPKDVRDMLRPYRRML